MRRVEGGVTAETHDDVSFQNKNTKKKKIQNTTIRFLHNQNKETTRKHIGGTDHLRDHSFDTATIGTYETFR